MKDKINTKQCNDCKEIKLLDEFYVYKHVSKNGEIKFVVYSYCKKCCVIRSRNYQKRNKEKYKIIKSNWGNTHLDLKHGRDRNWKKTNKDNYQEYQKTWRENNKDKIKTYTSKRYHKNHKISEKEWDLCRKSFDYACAYCGMSEKEHKKKYNEQLHKEHVDPSGSNNITNCVPSCKECNSEKNIYLLDEWYNNNNIKFTQDRCDKIMEWILKTT